ncbi:MAG TPA: NAD-dependent epimerase/dehydratase family protein, partial [Bacteroidales bacterium]|nr:NAD-dependent epimerase/dehydratase family protein [Bacteroidales bacterium]
MIVVTGAAGFIGSAMISKLNRAGYQNVIAVDHFDRDDKNANLTNLTISQFVNRDSFFQWLDNNHKTVEA